MTSWVNKSIFYHLYPLGFCNAPEYNDNVKVNRLDKFIEWIPHLKELGVNAVYFGPVFQSTKHGYDTKDYYNIDSRLGDRESFKNICNILHSNGIKIVLDGVFNHVGRDFWAFKDVQNKRENSEYCDWFHNIRFNGRSPLGDPFVYEGWGGCFDLVKLNLKNPNVVKHLLGAVELWIDEFGIDGLRLDAADCVDLDFFKQLRTFCKSKRNDFWLMGEIIHGNYNRWANKDTLDSVTNYECYKGLYSSHNDHNYFEIAHSLCRQFEQGGVYQNLCLYTFLDNHDVNRISSSLRDKNHLKNCYTLMYCMPGVPSIYYGSEWGIEGTRTKNSDVALRPALDLGKIPNADFSLNEYLKVLGKVRNNLEALQFGNYKNEVIKNEQLVFSRSYNNQLVYVALNISSVTQTVEFNVQSNCSKLTDALTNDTFDNTGYVKIPVPTNSARILVMNNGEYSINLNSDNVMNDNVTDVGITKDDIASDNVEQNIELPITDDLNNETATIQIERIPEEVTLGNYRHFKGNEYQVIAIGRHTETNEELVVYKDTTSHKIWVRPYSMFIDLVEIDGKYVPRFTKL
ncbi:MAG: DUF1653 domain-containing protein [Acutalibacteraceae bacterium]